MTSVLKLAPAYKDYIWGGTKLKEQFGKQFEGNCLAESWELSCHPDGESVIINGEAKGKTLKQYIKEQGEAILGHRCKKFDDFPILIKLIDAKDNLSIQVHPDNTYALEKEGQYGKTEMWYVVDCEEDAYLYYGLKKYVSKEELKQHIEENTLLEILNKVTVKKGDVFFIEAGTIHAIGKNMVIAEIQQNSNITYRVYDYGRIGTDGKKRELHIEKAIEVSNRYPILAPKHFGTHLASCDYFTVDKIELQHTLLGTVGEESFSTLLVVEGEGILTTQTETISFSKGDCLFISANTGSYRLTGHGVLLNTTVGEQYRIGVDLGGTNIKVGVVNYKNEIIAKHSIPTLVKREPKEIIKDISNAIYYLLDKENLTLSNISFIGIGSPGTIDSKNKVVIYSNNFDWEHIELVKELQQYISLPMEISNDANCAALGEVVAGAAKGSTHVVLLTLGTGVGSGIVMDGMIFDGAYAGGAEIGHTSLVCDGKLCTCGRKGCLEAYASASALIQDAKQAALEHPESEIMKLCSGDLEQINGKTPFDAAKQGDQIAKQVIEHYIQYLSEGIINIVNIFRPEKILLSGGVCNQGTYLTDPIASYVQQYCFANQKAVIPTISIAKLGNDAGIIGAANLK